MKFAAIASAAALVAVANAASCDVTSLQTLLTSSDTTTCATDSGYTVTSLATPTDAEMDVMCTSTACQSVLSQLETLAPSECTLGTFALYADLITPLSNHCAGATSTGSSTGSSSTTATVGSTDGSSTSATVTTSSTGSAGSTTTTTPTTSSGSSTSQTTTSSSSAASAAASASTSGSSGASMAAVSAGSVLVAVAAAMF
ncbi:Elicitin [Phytophthora infestans]|nr:elicitin-like INF7 [Phytophthora infestans]ABB55931.1 elicitin-like protein INL1 [Phytophthora infestans]KAF4030809.1 Elicitin [Phytophthora infestans]KAF4035609.1 Elicitin [Phytophthora infestans]KAF4129387.1 Elicitin [Phytophthora infestans]